MNTPDVRRWMGTTMIVAALLFMAACDPGSSTPVPTTAPTSPTSPAPVTASPSSAPRAAVPITLMRTGGFAGVRDSLYIDPAGAWVSQNKSSKKTTGQLTAAQVTQLQALAADPHVAVEAQTSPAPPSCADGFNYSVTVDLAEIRFSDCPHASEPRIAKAIVGLVQGAVPGW